ncbi:MAG: truA [Acidimicrobiaceae bacterium]|nr:truA [Acidimicrobiaceae bacterium]
MTLFELAEDSDAARPAGTRRVALGVAYDGSGFHGFAIQPGQRTVAGLLMEAAGRLVGSPVAYSCAGRTDKGVHALAQVLHVDLPQDLLASRYGLAPDTAPEELAELPGLARALDRQLGPEIACWRALAVPPAFDARRSALARRYHYDLDVAEPPDPRRRGSAWRVGTPLDLSVLRLATEPLHGEHDFGAFCRRPPGQPEGPINRRVGEARWRVLPEGLLRLEIEANAFCHQMVRSVVGALVAAAQGRLRPSDVVAMLRSASRVGAPSPAPPEGLCLVAVRYPEEFGGTWGGELGAPRVTPR